MGNEPRAGGKISPPQAALTLENAEMQRAPPLLLQSRTCYPSNRKLYSLALTFGILQVLPQRPTKVLEIASLVHALSIFFLL